MAYWPTIMIQKVWEKGHPVDDNSPDEWRKDDCGAWILREDYGKRDSEYGWDIGHISAGGSDSLANLRPLQWQNKFDEEDGRLRCRAIATGVGNVERL